MGLRLKPLIKPHQHGSAVMKEHKKNSVLVLLSPFVKSRSQLHIQGANQRRQMKQGDIRGAIVFFSARKSLHNNARAKTIIK